MKYNTEDEVYKALITGEIKRTSALSMKRRFKHNNDITNEHMFTKAIERFDNNNNELFCSYYNKPIDDLTLFELVDLYKKEPLMFSYNHCIKYSIEILGYKSKVINYKGMIIHPEESIYKEE